MHNAGEGLLRIYTVCTVCFCSITVVKGLVCWARHVFHALLESVAVYYQKYEIVIADTERLVRQNPTELANDTWQSSHTHMTHKE